jgi:hypothetical protein
MRASVASAVTNLPSGSDMTGIFWDLGEGKTPGATIE